MKKFKEFLGEAKDLQKKKEVLAKLSAEYGTIDAIGVKNKNGYRGLESKDNKTVTDAATADVYKINSRVVLFVKWTTTDKGNWFVYKSKGDFSKHKPIGIRSKDYADLISKIEG